MNKTFFVADTHFDHDDILKYTRATRPYPNVDAMNEAMARVWNETVDNKDLVYIIGDFAFKNHRKWINGLNGKKVMLIGSHDDMPHDTMDLFLGDEAWKAAGYVQNKASAEKTWHQFREVHDSLIRRVNGRMIHMYHWPLQSWQDKPKGAWHLHGHVHGRFAASLPGDARKGLVLDVGWDVWKRPVEFAEIKTVMDEKWRIMKQSGVGRQEF
jgi:calcineurin-like phosphoesterase family protein